MWGRGNNFQVSMLYELRNRKEKKYVRDVFAVTPFRDEMTNDHSGYKSMSWVLQEMFELTSLSGACVNLCFLTLV